MSIRTRFRYMHLPPHFSATAKHTEHLSCQSNTVRVRCRQLSLGHPAPLTDMVRKQHPVPCSQWREKSLDAFWNAASAIICLLTSVASATIFRTALQVQKHLIRGARSYLQLLAASQLLLRAIFSCCLIQNPYDHPAAGH